MTIEVIGAGFGRTGTLSLKFALETFSSENSFCLKIEVDFLYLKGGLNCSL